MSEWEVKYPVKITATEDTIQDGFEKLRQEMPVIYRLLNRLRRNDAGSGQDVLDAEAYSFRIDTTLNHLLIRKGDNSGWIDLGELKENFGITAESIGAVVQKSTSGSFMFGDSSARPDETDPEVVETLKTNDMYLSMNEKKIYRWTGFAWETFLSLNFGDILNYERYTINRDEVAYSGADKILRLDRETGKGNISITGSPDMIIGKEIDVQDLHDGDVLVYNAEKDKIVNLPNYIFTQDDVSYTGEPGKILVVSNADRKAHVDITGSPDRIAGKKIEINNLQDGDVLAFDEETGKMLNIPYGGKVGGVKVDTTGIKNNQVLIYDADKDELVPGYIIPVVATATIPTTGWIAKDNGAYKFYYDIPAASVEEDSFVQVVIDNLQHEVLLDCGLSPTCDPRTGFIRVWSIEIPAQEINAKYMVMPSHAVVS
jgi:hypothetical protein